MSGNEMDCSVQSSSQRHPGNRKRQRDDSSNNPKSKQAKSEVLPIVVSKVEKKFLESSKCIADALKDIESSMVDCRTTAAGNIMLFCRDNATREKILSNPNRFGISTMSDIKTKPSEEFNVVIYGIDYEFANEHRQAIKSNGVVDIIEMKSFRKGQKLNMVRCICKCKESQEKLISSGLKVGYVKCQVGEYERREKVIQCYRCQNFGHIAAKCKGRERCSRCGQLDHNVKSCKSKPEEAKCANCGGNHGSAWAGCPKYKAAIEAKHQVKQSSPMGSFPNYSAAAQASQATIPASNGLVEKVEQVMSTCLNKVNETVEKFTNAIIEINNNITNVINQIAVQADKIQRQQEVINAQSQEIKQLKEQIANVKTDVQHFLVDFPYIMRPNYKFDDSYIKDFTTYFTTAANTYFGNAIDAANITTRLKRLPSYSPAMSASQPVTTANKNSI